MEYSFDKALKLAKITTKPRIITKIAPITNNNSMNEEILIKFSDSSFNIILILIIIVLLLFILILSYCIISLYKFKYKTKVS